MDMKLGLILLATLVNGLIGLVGGVIPTSFIQRNIGLVLAFAAGTLLGVAFFELIPEALTGGSSPVYLMSWVMGGFLLFHTVESLFQAHSCGEEGHRHTLIGPFILTGDALHNITDGVAIAAAFMVDVRVGIATSIAVILHEIPHEMSDYAILISQGYSRARSLLLLFLVQLTSVLGALVTYAAAQFMTEAVVPVCLALSAGGFIYIGAADLLPEVRNRRLAKNNLSSSAIFISGLAIMALFAYFE
ncbi:MAG TPA: hypothetical protein DCS07_03350 [Bdellovibrionales bacterium]|nr:MAG: hypothetical protein A2Z97_06810 [Bdellovibrionales bacterium GWB1_52_6]OFZ05480.1 MAG: hypothetical protein A2X97_11430 [Bdellovibrionales bacterium GWA1_52_35]OFZ38412.1 MAG: hypothetical protein A2070_00850 [Bdellovibrionales bacterium GWC1_52_8]HAR41657.1 hypothetical protein [Bdellovibrionales bacterium]HCM39154.1 hypothetical protein [Bdellovibrionales bacterium]